MLGEAEGLLLALPDLEGEPLGQGVVEREGVREPLREPLPDPVPPSDAVAIWVEEGHWEALGDLEAEGVLEAQGEAERVK